jgi:serine/threonine protein kinase
VSDTTSGAGLDATLRDFSAGQKVFGRYKLIRTLGRGGMGIVWLAHDEVLDRDVALKFLPEIVVHDRAVLEDLKRETKRNLDLTHKNIVRIHDFIHDVISGCISMEYVEGDTLSNLRADRPAKIFEPDEIKPWLNQLCEALDYAHNYALIIHRDLKPSNLMISKRGHLKVADFGIARSLSDSVSMLTHARGTSGTLVYMSPQQLDGERGTHLDDIYSIGATIYELLTSKPPFYSGNIDRQIHEKVPPSMTQRRKEIEIPGNPIPTNWEETVAACLAKDPARRPQSVAEVANRLQLGSTATVPSSAAIPSFSNKKLIAFVAVALLTCGIALSIWMFIPRGPKKSDRPIASSPAAPPAPAFSPSTEKPANDSTVATSENVDSRESDVEKQRRYLYEMYARNTTSGLKATPSPSASSFLSTFSPSPPSYQYDGVWTGRDSSSDWTSTLKIASGTATVTLQVVNKLRPKTDHWNDIPAPYNRSRTLTFRWSSSSNNLRITNTAVIIYWSEWKSSWEPSGIPYSTLAKIYHKPPTGQFNPIYAPRVDWQYTVSGAQLTTGSWVYRRNQ